MQLLAKMLLKYVLIFIVIIVLTLFISLVFLLVVKSTTNSRLSEQFKVAVTQTALSISDINKGFMGLRVEKPGVNVIKQLQISTSSWV